MDIVRAFTANNLHTEITIKGTVENPLFRASDIAEILGIINIRQAVIDFNESEKVITATATNGGEQQVIFLTEKGLYKMLFRSRKNIAVIFQDWVCEVLKNIRLKGKYESESKLKELEEEKKKLELENTLLKNAEQSKNPIIYIYDTDARELSSIRKLKIGITENISQRFKPYQTITPFGRMVFTMDVPRTQLHKIEKWIHIILAPYNTAGEIFEMNIEEAKMWIMREIMTLNLSYNQDSDEKRRILTKLVDSDKNILNGVKIGTCDVACQTGQEEVLIPMTNSKTSREQLFDDYISECCEIGDGTEVAVTDIVGQYRIWAQSADAETFRKLHEYLNAKFKTIRLHIPDQDEIIHGFTGIKLKEREYDMPDVISDPQSFVFKQCKFHPSGKILMRDIVNEYNKWCESIGKTGSAKDIKNYLKTCKYVLDANLWTLNGNGQGYYGICLKEDNMFRKKPCTNAKKVEKRDLNDKFLNSWPTIEAAARAEGMPPTRMSRNIKNKKRLTDCYYMFA